MSRQLETPTANGRVLAAWVLVTVAALGLLAFGGGALFSSIGDSGDRTRCPSAANPLLDRSWLSNDRRR